VAALVPDGVPDIDPEGVARALGVGFVQGSEGPGLHKTKPARYQPAAAERLDGLRLGVLRNFAAEPVEPAIATAFRAALDKLTGLGAEIRTVEIPSYDMARGRRAGFVRIEVEAAFVHAELYRTQPERFSPQMRSYLEWGSKAPATTLVRADRRIDVAAFELTRCFEDVDAIVSPTTPQAAPAFADKAPDNAGAFCVPANFAGCPAIAFRWAATNSGCHWASR